MMFTFNLFINLAIAVLILKFTTANDAGTKCTRSICEQKKGYIEHHRGSIGRWTIRTPDNSYTTFVLLITNVEGGPVTNSFLPWLRVSQHKYAFDAEHDIRDSGKRLMVLEDANRVTISLQRYDVSHFRVDYYVGCEIAEEDTTRIVRESSYHPEEDPAVSPRQQPHYYPIAAPGYNFYQYNPFSGRPRSAYVPPQPVRPVVNRNQGRASFAPSPPKPTCWIIIPTITEELERTAEDIYYISRGFYPPIRTRSVDVKRTYLTFQNMTMSDETTLYATDMMTGSTLMSSTGSDQLLVATLDKTEDKPINYKDKLISSLIFVGLMCTRQQGCEQAEFMVGTKALQQSDVECIEREQKCRFNIGEKEFNCTPPLIPPFMYVTFFNISESDLENSNCPAFNEFFQSIVSTVDSISTKETNDTHDEDEEGSGSEDKVSIIGRNYTPEQQKRIQKKLKKCNNYPAYCSKPCGKFKRWGCSKICYLFKVQLNICSFFFPSIFA